MPLSVRRRISGACSVQPSPNGEFPAPESYSRASAGATAPRPGLAGSGTDSWPVPVADATDSFSPKLRTAPPPFGSDTEGSPRCGPGSAALGEVALVVLSTTTSRSDHQHQTRVAGDRRTPSP